MAPASNSEIFKNPTLILITGILSLSLSWLYGFPGLILGILTIRNIKSSGKAADKKNSRIKYGKYFAIYGIFISSVFVFLLLFKWFLILTGK